MLNAQTPSSVNPEGLRLVQPNEFLPPVGRWATFGSIAMLAIFGGTIALAAVLKYPTTVKAPVIIRPTGDLRIVQATTTGKVNRIEVKTHQVVQQGQAIAYLDDSRLQTQKRQLQSSIQQTQRQLNQLDAQIQTVQTQSAAEVQAYQRGVAAAGGELRLNQRQHQERQTTAQADVREAEAAVKLAQEELTRYRTLANTGAVSQSQIGEKTTALEVALARLQRTQAALNPSAASVEIATEKVEQERSRGAATLATLHKEQEALIQQRVKLQNELTRDRQELQQVKADSANTIVRSPATGTIQQLNLRNPNQVVQSGDLIAQIAPSNVPLIIKSYVSTQEIGQVKIGQPVSIKVSGCPYPDYGTLAGTVTAISPDASVSPSPTATSVVQDPPNPLSSGRYEVMIQSQTRFLGSPDRPCYLQAGMDGSAEIVTRQETVLLFLLKKARLLIRV
ncbi:HlyD family secretion protein [Leptolyngbya sp. Cla-17]|uniref:HlyD family secretion protein n=1 Tax=Leptolyngbya sp. Cla-17 TaxID=2803751 RepID=UPI001F5D071F|nr:HlyD family efflux transporter periplasmic adaptor subunit [Leptolyngbya sp. Cla-17]